LEEVKLRKKKSSLFLIAICIFSVVAIPASAPPSHVRAQEEGEHKVYLPLILNPSWLFFPIVQFIEPILREEFSTDPGWPMVFIKDPKDGFFEHGGDRYLGHIRDNAAMFITSPLWRPAGDYMLEVDGKHKAPLKKSFNGLGLAFNATDDWKDYYALMIGAAAAQHFWTVVRFENTRARYLTNGGYRGGPSSMRNYDDWNRLMVTMIDGVITAYCNGSRLANGQAEAKHYAPNRLVGLVVTSYEFSNGLVEFDNMQLTPLYEDDIEEIEGQVVETEAYEFDTPALDLHH
jgi:hypothetical protein